VLLTSPIGVSRGTPSARRPKRPGGTGRIRVDVAVEVGQATTQHNGREARATQP
jgi:hypothetical protein